MARPTILILEDDPAVLALLGEALGGAGDRVVAAAGVAEAATVLARGPLDPVLTDAQRVLAGGAWADPWAALDGVRALAGGAPVVSVTGRARPTTPTGRPGASPGCSPRPSTSTPSSPSSATCSPGRWAAERPPRAARAAARGPVPASATGGAAGSLAGFAQVDRRRQPGPPGGLRQGDQVLEAVDRRRHVLGPPQRLARVGRRARGRPGWRSSELQRALAPEQLSSSCSTVRTASSAPSSRAWAARSASAGRVRWCRAR